MRENKTRTSKVCAISKAQKAQNIFGKKPEIFENFSLSENVAQCRKIKGGPFGTLQNFRKKVAQCRKNQKVTI